MDPVVEGTTEGAAAATPQFVPVEQFKLVEQQVAGLAGQNEALQKTIQGLHALVLQGQRQPPAQRAAIDDVAEAELDEAVTTGSGAGAKISKKIEARVERLVRERIEPLQQLGLSTMANFAAEQAKMARNDKGEPLLPYYQRYKDEIDTIINGLPVNLRLNPQTYVEAHTSVVGRHAAELIEEAKTGAIRETEQGKADPPTPNGRVGRNAGKGGIPRFEEHFSPDVVKALGDQSPDQFCQNLGYKNWDDYYQKTVVGA